MKVVCSLAVVQLTAPHPGDSIGFVELEPEDLITDVTFG